MKLVQTGHLYEYGEVEIEEVFDAYFSDPNWKFLEEDGKKYVVFSGGCTYQDKPVEAEIYFVIANNEETFSIAEIDINNSDMPDLIGMALIEKVYEEYYAMD